MDTILPIPSDRSTDHAFRALGPAIQRIRGALRHRSGPRSGPSPAVMASIVREIAAFEPAAAAWRTTLLRGGDPTVVALGAQGSEPVAVLRVARQAAAGLLNAERAQRFAREAMGSGGAVVPEILASGTTGDAIVWVAERALPGDPGRARMSDVASRARAVAGVARAIAPLHQSGGVRPVTAEDVSTWVTDRVRFVGHVAGDHAAGAGSWAADTEAILVAAVGNRSLSISRIHGDLWLENVRFAPGTDRVTAIVDWDSAAHGELPLQDLVHLAITTRRRAERRDFGPVLVEALDAARSAPEQPVTLGRLLGSTGPAGSLAEALDAPIASDLQPVATLLLAWLRFVEINVTRHPELGRDRRWVEANIRGVVAWR